MKVLERKFNENKIKDDYKKVVWFYDFWSWLTESKAAKKVLEFAEIKTPENILEIACGTGIVFEKLVQQNPNGKNMGVDISSAMLEKARKRMSKSNLSNFRLEEANALNIGFENNSFSLIINNFMLDLMPDEKFDFMAAEFFRLLKPGGRLVISTFSFGKKKYNKFWLYVAKKFPDLLTSCRPISFGKHLIKAGFNIEKSMELSQNTFPSEIISAVKI